MKTPSYEFDTLTEAMSALRKQGYVEDFNLKHNWIENANCEHKLFHTDFVVDSFYRFEGMTDPADEAILYAISSDKSNIKGVLVDGYGISADPDSVELMSKLNFR